MLRCFVGRRAAAAPEIEAALAQLDGSPGVYFGCDAGVPGLHPLQATLLVEPAVALRVFADGVDAVALDALGGALLTHPALAAFVSVAGCGAGRSALAAVRAFLSAFDAGDDALLVGALRFEAYCLASPALRATVSEATPLGVLFFAPTLLRRDADGDWHRVQLRFEDPVLADLQARDRVPQPRSGETRGDASIPVPEDDFPPGGYAAMLARAVQRIERAPLVSLTLSQSFRRRVDAGTSAARAFDALRRANPAPSTFFVNTGDGECVFGASPDLQLRVFGRGIESFPVCGTVARGHGPVGEAESFRQLINEDVDAASLAVCTDAMRNDLAPLCEPGSLRLCDRRRPMALATVVHTVDRLSGRVRAGADAWDAIVATAAPVMVTGTPRRLALAAIEEFEAGTRGWYGGLVVQVDASGNALAGTILRAAAIRDGVAEVRTGGDLMADSDPAREEHESRVKAVSLWRALGMPVASDLQAGLAGATPTSLAPADALPVAVALLDAGDPFVQAMAETLQAMGLALDAAATPVVLVGANAACCADEAARGSGLVAIGDAAALVLEHAGFAVAAIRPEHGRLIQCVPNENVPGQPARAFTAMRYATLAVDWASEHLSTDASSWAVWIRDDRRRPLVLAHAERRTVCMLLRPDSLLSDKLARDALRAAIAFAAGLRAA
ncbi:MAG: chorismate-binding protein [Betaproteobacteria bacterium]|nr:chorismate-binding protein [Betaproteobacteria bacterium]